MKQRPFKAVLQAWDLAASMASNRELNWAFLRIPPLFALIEVTYMDCMLG
jgi:hypothetical protein